MPTGGSHVYDALLEAGIELLVGLPGTQTLPLDRVVAERDEMEYVMARHETAVPHYAWGHYEASGRPAATLTVPGPGDTNAMHGLKNALEDSVPLIHVSADADPDHRGRGPIHEIAPDTYDNVVKANLNVEDPLRFREVVERGVETALTPPYGPVRLGLPSTFLEREFDAPPVTVEAEETAFANAAAYEDAAALLAGAERPVVYVGGGTRRADGGDAAALELVETLDCPFLTSVKGKGVIPEDDPRAVGVTASYLPASGKAVLERADVVVALGTDFDGVTTGNWSLPMGDSLVHVTLSPETVGAAYEADVAVVDDAGAAARELAERVDGPVGWDGPAVAGEARAAYLDHLESMGVLAESSPAHTPATLRAIREAVPREAVVVTDVGGHRLWALEVFDAYGQDRYVTAGSWAGMGVGLPGALGAKLARPDAPVVCLHGDGGLMMCQQELHTAVEHGIDVVTVVFDNEDYGIISKSPEIRDYGGGARFSWQSPDFVALAESFGARGTRVDAPADAADAVAAALDREGPELVVVDVPTDEPSVKDAADF